MLVMFNFKRITNATNTTELSFFNVVIAEK